ncbi:hypothetical protein K9M79_05800 [Candidatus Woesearchaeota archaeon]|nr:hypothetical protein [Candidatus Woesearchaeota archaeon]
MVLTAVVGKHKIVNKEIFRYAFDSLPSIVLDCANTANPHSFYPKVTIEDLSRVYVISVDALYRFRDSLKYIPKLAKQLKPKSIIITSFEHLFNYDDKLEIHNINVQAWDIILDFSKKYDTYIAVNIKSVHIKFAKRYCDKIIKSQFERSESSRGKKMGHTVSSQRIVINTILRELKDFGRALRSDDREAYERMLALPLKHIGTMSYASSLDVWALILLSISLEQQKRIDVLEKTIKKITQNWQRC